MRQQQLPPDWAALATRKGIRPSARGIADAADLATSTVTRLIREGRTSPETVTAVAAALGVPEAKIHELANVAAHTDLGPWSPPAEANQLGGAERQVLEDLIRVMAKGDSSASRQLKAQKNQGDGLQPGIVADVITSGADATVHQLPERRVASRPSKAEQERRRQRDQDD